MIYEYNTISKCLWKMIYEYNTISKCLWKMIDEYNAIDQCLWEMTYEYNAIGKCFWKILYERKYNKVEEIHMKHKKCIEEIPKIHETQEMYRGNSQNP
jgi:hypothetical protein